MSIPEIKFCPGTLAEGHNTYNKSCLNRLFFGKKVNHILDYDSPASNPEVSELFEANRSRLSVSGVQEKFSLVLKKNKLRLTERGERGLYILKPVPGFGKNPDQFPMNEHLTMQIARQIFGVSTAENALIFFKDGSPAYITKRFDINRDGGKVAQEDFASLAGRTPQTHGEHFKYLGNYLELFHILKNTVPAYKVEAPKLFKLLMFNYLFSNGDAHYKNFSILETTMGDFHLSPAYDLLNTNIHINDQDFALDDGLLPRDIAHGKIQQQFLKLANLAEINSRTVQHIFKLMTSQSKLVEKLIATSYLNSRIKRNYLQSYQNKLKRLLKE
jgi:serine/threonine-protein kinase HipA